MEAYEKPEIEIITFSIEDIILTSGGGIVNDNPYG